MPYYLSPTLTGIISANSNFDGTSITIKWSQAYPQSNGNKIAYIIYMDNEKSPDFVSTFFNKNPSFISIDGYTSATIQDLTPGNMYHFGVRAAEYNTSIFDLSLLPTVYNDVKTLPSSLLRNDVLFSDMIIPIIDADGFPASGTIKLGIELIKYSSISTNDLIVSQRGYGQISSRSHTIDGYDGYSIQNPEALLWTFVNEEQNTKVYECQSRFDLRNQKYLVSDGYHQKSFDLLNTDMTVSDEINTGFPAYDFSGYHRTTPEMVLSGKCINSYIGGVRGCVDGKNGSVIIRGVSSVVQNQQRQEVLLNIDGEPVILMKRQWTGVTCTCYIPTQEYPEARCGKCFGSGFLTTYQQYFSPRRSDKKIMVRFDPTVDSVDPTESGLESVSKPNCWTMTVPSIFERDFIVRFDQNGNEEFRYEVLNVTRNKFILNNTGLQRFSLQRIRKTDIIYQIPVIENVNTNTNGTSGNNVFRTLSTSINMSAGFAPHIHTIEANQNIINALQINGITSVSQGHSHTVINGVLRDGSEVPGEVGIGHIHSIIFTPP